MCVIHCAVFDAPAHLSRPGTGVFIRDQWSDDGPRQNEAPRVSASGRPVKRFGHIAVAALLAAMGNGYPIGPQSAASATPGADQSRHFPDYVDSVDVERLHRNMCGPFSVLAIARALGVQVSLDEVRDAADRFGETGSTLLDLKTLAQGYGLYAKAVETALESLPTLGLYAIVHVQDDHFVAVMGYSEDSLQILDFPRPAQLVRLTDARKHEVHKCLLLAGDPRDLEFGDNILILNGETGDSADERVLAASETNLDTGVVYSEWSTTIELANLLDRAVRVASVQSSCTCLDATTEPSTIGPRGSAKLHLTLSRQDRYGGFRHKVFVHVSDPRRAILELSVGGFRERPLLVDPPVVTLYDVPAGRPASSVLDVHLRAPVSVGDLEIEVPSGAPVVTSLHNAGDAQVRLRFDWLGSRQLGWHRYRMLIRDKGSGQSLAPPILAAVEVVPRVVAEPCLIIFMPGWTNDTCQRRIKVRSGGSGGKVNGISFRDARLSSAILTSILDQGDHSVVTLTGDREALRKLENFSSEFAITCSNGQTVNVPIHVMRAQGEERQVYPLLSPAGTSHERR